jgi:hypothetical protein
MLNSLHKLRKQMHNKSLTRQSDAFHIDLNANSHSQGFYGRYGEAGGVYGYTEGRDGQVSNLR